MYLQPGYYFLTRDGEDQTARPMDSMVVEGSMDGWKFSGGGIPIGWIVARVGAATA